VAYGDLPASTRPLELAAALLAVAQGQCSLSRAGLSKTVLESVSRSAARALLSPGDPSITPATTIRRARGVPTAEHERRQGRRGRSGPR
jgi:hypothetical protein